MTAWLAAHWQDLLTGAAIAAAAAFIGRRWYIAAKNYKYGASCGACPSNPDNQRSANDVAIDELRGPRSS